MARHLLPAAARLAPFSTQSATARPAISACIALMPSHPFLSHHRHCGLAQHRRAFSASAAASSSSSASKSPSASAPLTVFSMQMPQLSPSMTSGRIAAFHCQPGTAITPAALVFTLTTRTLLAPDASSPASASAASGPASGAGADTPAGHTMLVESHDPGVVGWLDGGLVASGREVAVGHVVGWLWEDDGDRRRAAGSEGDVHKAVLRAAEAAAAAGGSGGEQVSDVGALTVRVKPFVWQAYVAEGERQEGECAPSRKE